MATSQPTQLALPKSIGPTPAPIVLAAVFCPLAIVAVLLRFYSRRIRHAPLLMDDWIIIPALIFSVAQAVILVVNACLGDLGKHQPLDSHGDAIPSPKLELFQQLEYVSFLTFVPALLFAKLSCLHLYNRIFNVREVFRSAIWFMYAVNVAWGVAFFVGYIFKCWPIAQYWQTANEEGHCLPNSFNYAFAFSNVILDVGILVMPLPVVWSLNMVPRQKLAVTGVFMLGSTVVVLSIAKAVAFFYTFAWVEHNNDIMFDEAPLFYYSVPEALVAVISACLPPLAPLFRKMSAPITDSVSSATHGASAAATKTVIHVTNSIDLSSRGIPMRKQGHQNAASPQGLGRERGLLVSRNSMAGGVMWDRCIRRSDELAARANYAPWIRDSDYIADSTPKSASLSTFEHTSDSAPSSDAGTLDSTDPSAQGLGLQIETASAMTTPRPSYRAPSPLGRLAWQASMYSEPGSSTPPPRPGAAELDLQTPHYSAEHPLLTSPQRAAAQQGLHRTNSYNSWAQDNC